MDNCPICRASLNGRAACRRCRAELQGVQEVEGQARRLAGAAMHRLASGDTAEALRLLRRACATHATPELRVLLQHLLRRRFAAGAPRGEAADEDKPAAQCDGVLHFQRSW